MGQPDLGIDIDTVAGVEQALNDGEHGHAVVLFAFHHAEGDRGVRVSLQVGQLRAVGCAEYGPPITIGRRFVHDQIVERA